MGRGHEVSKHASIFDLRERHQVVEFQRHLYLKRENTENQDEYIWGYNHPETGKFIVHHDEDVPASLVIDRSRKLIAATYMKDGIIHRDRGPAKIIRRMPGLAKDASEPVGWQLFWMKNGFPDGTTVIPDVVCLETDAKMRSASFCLKYDKSSGVRISEFEARSNWLELTWHLLERGAVKKSNIDKPRGFPQLHTDLDRCALEGIRSTELLAMLTSMPDGPSLDQFLASGLL